MCELQWYRLKSIEEIIDIATKDFNYEYERINPNTDFASYRFQPVIYSNRNHVGRGWHINWEMLTMMRYSEIKYPFTSLYGGGEWPGYGDHKCSGRYTHQLNRQSLDRDMKKLLEYSFLSTNCFFHSSWFVTNSILELDDEEFML